MNRYQPSEDRPAPSTPAPGAPALLRHLALVEGSERMPPRTLRDVVGGNDWEGRSVERLARLVGGLDALESLDAEPLPTSEPFEFGAIDATDLPAVQSVLDALHDHRPPYFDAFSKVLGSYTPVASR